MTSFAEIQAFLAGAPRRLGPVRRAGLRFRRYDLLNVSYDPTRELYKDFNAAFAAKWKADTGETVTIQQSMAARASRPGR